ncbi:MBL fold metallo-hydrolase [Nonomuraea sp. NPDC050536]|uniref:MBL fold metallo-hydrolase n=1 Tax=Nonomuraea sp. NPDC050536 TaxID=3364366 RepID=UPI0037CC65F7
MKVHHLNFGTMREIDPEHDGLAPASALNHCLLVETDSDGLVLVETGFGTVDVERPVEALGQTFLDRTQAVLDPAETGVRQLARLGFAAEDVRHIVLTHLDLDHSGGLPDFPEAKVHLHDAEYRAAMAATSTHPEHALRYRPAHWEHRPHWVTYETRKGLSWFGFDALELEGLPSDILLVPLPGHTEGHCAVAVKDGEKWLLHAGDAFYYHGQIDPEARWEIPLWNALEEIATIHRPLNMGQQARLRELLREHGDEVEVFSAHDPWAFQRYV